MVYCGSMCVHPMQPDNVLKATGDEAFRAGEYATAVERFTHVLSLEPRFVAALSNRAAAHLAAGQLEACVSDCSAALGLLGHVDLLGSGGPGAAAPSLGGALDVVAVAAAVATAAATPAGSQGGHSRASADPARNVLDVVAPSGSARHRSFVVTTLVRRGTATAQLGDAVAALRDLGQALALDPRNTQVAAEVKRLQARVAAAPPLVE
jgi:dyslexia susceptibility 1 candidate gene 1 protein